jgi:hypothetical protein
MARITASMRYNTRTDEVDEYLASAESDAVSVRDEKEKRFDPTGIRARLLAKGKVQSPSANNR